MARSSDSSERVVLFVCEHGAAKSMLAAELLESSAASAGLRLTVHAAGVDPSNGVADGVLALLPGRAAELRRWAPRRVSRGDIEQASVTVTFNLDAGALPITPREPIAWDDVPAVSADPLAARASIERHVAELVERLRA